MNDGNTYYGSAAPSGWQCGSCMAHVPWGTMHSCVGFLTPTVEERIASALERIATALEGWPVTL